MFGKGFFKVEEIGIFELGPAIHLKGRKKSLFEEQELVRYMFAPKYLKEIISLTKGTVGHEAQFARNVFKLAGVGIQEIKIYRINEGHITSDLKFSNGTSISRVLPGLALMYVLALKGIGNGADVYCHEDLYETGESLYKIRNHSNTKHKWIREFRDKAMVKFRKIEDIKFEDKKLDVNVNEDEYVKLGFVRILMQLVVPDTVIYERGSRQYGFPFPMNKVTFEKALRDHRINSARIRFDDPYNPGWQADSMTIINHVIKRANIKVDSIYIDGTLGRYVSKNFLRYNPKSAKIILKKDGERIVITAPWEKAISLSFLNSKEIMIRERTKPYVA